MDGEDRVHLPVAQDCVDNLVRVASELPSAAERQFVSEVAVEDVGDVVIAKSVIQADVVGVLLEGHVGAGLAGRGIAVSSVIAHRVGETFRQV